MRGLILAIGLLFSGAKLVTAQSAVTFAGNACTVADHGSSNVTRFEGCNVSAHDSVVVCLAVPTAFSTASLGGEWGALCYDDGGTDHAPSNIWVKERDTWDAGGGYVRLMCFDALNVPNSFATIKCLHATWAHRAGLALRFTGAVAREPTDRFQLASAKSSILTGLDVHLPQRVYPNDMLIMAVASSIVDSPASTFTPPPGWNLPLTPGDSSGSTRRADRQIEIVYQQVNSVNDNPHSVGGGAFAESRWWAAGVFALSAGPAPTSTPTVANTATPTP